MDDDIRVLYVDDNATSLMLRSDLLNEFDSIAVSTATSVTEGLALLDETDFDCILSDLYMPNRDGMEFLAAVRERDPHLPFILFSAIQPDGIVEKALAANVTDYVVKDDADGFHHVLVNRIEQYVAHHRATKWLFDPTGPEIPQKEYRRKKH